MSSKEIPKKLILVVLSIIFFTFAPLAINAYLIAQIGVKNTITAIMEGVATETFSSSLKETCDKQDILPYSECETLALDQLCLQYAGEPACSGIGAKGKDYFVSNILLPDAVSKINEMPIPNTGVKVGELDALAGNLFVISVAMTLISVILMIMMITTPKDVLKTMGANIILVGLPMSALAYAANSALPSAVSKMAGELADQQTTGILTNAVVSGIKPFLDAQIQIGVVLTVLGLAAVASSKIFFNEKKLLRK